MGGGRAEGSSAVGDGGQAARWNARSHLWKFSVCVEGPYCIQYAEQGSVFK